METIQNIANELNRNETLNRVHTLNVQLNAAVIEKTQNLSQVIPMRPTPCIIQGNDSVDVVSDGSCADASCSCGLFVLITCA